MKEWIIAMLVIIGLLIIRDMAKTVFSGRRELAAARMPQKESHPQKERVEHYAQSFQKLADSFYGLPSHQDVLGEEEKDQILRQCHETVCGTCYQRELCWITQGGQTLEGAYELINAIEDGREEQVRRARGSWMSLCGRSGQFYEAAWRYFQREKQRQIWNNRMVESRLASAQQLAEMSRIMQQVASELYDVGPAQEAFAARLSKKLKKKHVLLRQIWEWKQEEGHRELYLEMKARSGQCVTVQEVAQAVSECCGCPMTAAQDSRCVLGSEYHTVCFREEVSYHMLYGVAKAAKEQEKVSGDSYACRREEGQYWFCLSDGMGSGMEASRESERVVELLEQFMEAGFSQDAAARMINSVLVLQREEGRFSTLDPCSVDLYTGICSFLKAGASTTFIKRDHWVEAISSTSLAVGLMQRLDYESTSRKLYHGDYLIMVTDGVMDAFPVEQAEERLKEIVMELKCQTPAEMARGILDRALAGEEYRAKDDMTVLVAGMWKSRRYRER